MSDEISNKTLVMLLVAAIVVSLGGTLVSLNKLSELQYPGLSLTGFATSGGSRANLSVESTLSVQVADEIQFGKGYVNTSAGCSGATMESNVSFASNPYSKCLEQTVGSGGWKNYAGTDAITVTNIGNLLANITMSANVNCNSWLSSDSSCWYGITARDTSNNACSVNPVSGWQDWPGTSDTNVTICETLATGPASNDTVSVGVKVNVSQFVSVGNKEVVLTFWAKEV